MNLDDIDQTFFVQHFHPLTSIIPWFNNIEPRTSKSYSFDDENPSQPSA